MESQLMLNDVLSNLRSLTCLSLNCCKYQRIPPSLSRLSRLQRLSFDCKRSPSAGSVIYLLKNASLSSIRWLGLPWAMPVYLSEGVARLHQAVCLDYLCISTPWPKDAPAAANIDDEFEFAEPRPAPVRPPPPIHEDHPLWAFAATHPPLRCLGFALLCHHTVFTQQPSIAHAIATLRLRRPNLQLRYFRHMDGFANELLNAGDIPQAP